MGLVNHFLDVEIDLFGEVILIPDAIKAGTTNSLSSITAQTGLCVNSFGREPNFVLVSFSPPIRSFFSNCFLHLLTYPQLDFISIGQAIAAQNQLNGL